MNSKNFSTIGEPSQTRVPSLSTGQLRGNLCQENEKYDAQTYDSEHDLQRILRGHTGAPQHAERGRKKPKRDRIRQKSPFPCSGSSHFVRQTLAFKRRTGGFEKSQLKEKAAAYYNSTANNLKPLVIGTRVSIQDVSIKRWDKIGEIVAVGSRRNYRVKMSTGHVYWRNRRFLRKMNVTVEDEEDASADIREEESENRDGKVATDDDHDEQPAV